MKLFPKDKTKSPAMYQAVIFLVTLGIYWNSLQGGFIWDDRGLILEHADYLNDWRNLFTVFTQPFFGNTPFYRPLLIGSFIADYQLWGLHPFGYHFSNVLFHALNGCMVYLLAFFLFKQRAVAFIAALLFATHPIQTEAVAWISGRNDVLLTFFSLLTIVLYLRWRTNQRGKERVLTYLGFLVSYCCVLLTKESGIILLVLIMLIDYFFRATLPAPLKGRREVYLSLTLITVVYFLVRMSILGSFGIETPGQGFIPLFLGMTSTYTYYGKMLLLPLVQSASPLLPSLISFKDPLISPSFFFLPSLVIITLLCWRRFWELSFVILWILVALFPVSGIVSLTVPALEHRLYLASVCFSMVIPLLFYRVSLLTDDKRSAQLARKVIPPIVLLLICVYSIKTVTRNTIWRDEHHFWVHTVRNEPLSACAHNNVGIVYANEGRYREAVRAFEKALSLQGEQHALMPQCRQTKVYNNLGRAYYSMLEASLAPDETGVPGEGERERLFQNSLHYYQKALQVSPDNVEVYNNLGDLHYLTHSYQSAAQEYRRALQLNPSYAEAYNNLGVTYLEIKRYHDAEQAFIKALEVKPHFLEARNNLALVYMQGGLYHKALQALQEVVRVAPDNAGVHFNLALLYVRAFKDREKGSYHLKESLRLKPSPLRAKAMEGDLARLISAEILEK